MAQFFYESLHIRGSPGISDFTQAALPDVAAEFKESRFWMTNHFLNSTFGAAYEAPWKLRLTTLLMRCSTAVRFYSDARDATAAFLDTAQQDRPRLERYFHALSLWEAVLVNYAIAVSVHTRALGTPAFKPGDGSSDQRAYDLYNIVKHVAAREDVGDIGDQAVAMWMTNKGLTDGILELGWEELADLMRDLARLADRPAPCELREGAIASGASTAVARRLSSTPARAWVPTRSAGRWPTSKATRWFAIQAATSGLPR
jgi:hypothetical protein